MMMMMMKVTLLLMAFSTVTVRGRGRCRSIRRNELKDLFNDGCEGNSREEKFCNGATNVMLGAEFPNCQCEAAIEILLEGPDPIVDLLHAGAKDSCLNCSNIRLLLNNLDKEGTLRDESERCTCRISKRHILDDKTDCLECDEIKTVKENNNCKCYELGCAPIHRHRCYLPYPDLNSNDGSYSYATYHEGFGHDVGNAIYKPQAMTNNGPPVGDYGNDHTNTGYGYEEPMCTKELVHDYNTMAYPPKPPAPAVTCKKTFEHEYNEYKNKYEKINGALTDCQAQKSYQDAPNGAASVGVLLAMASAIATAGIFA